MGTEESNLDHFGYQLAGELSTTNAGTEVGDSEMAEQVSGRLFPGVFVPGPNGQMIPNSDLVTTQVLPGTQRRVVYTLSDEATFSDGEPVTCTDYFLAFTAGQRPEVFGSHMPLYSEAESMSCTPDSKEFTVVFKEGGGARWRGLFSGGTVVPAHAVAARLGMTVEDLHARLSEGDEEELGQIASVWRDAFSLRAFDSAMQVSFGPYRIESVGSSGDVELVANESYYGDAARIPNIVVWPASSDSAALREAGAVRVAELTEPDPAWLDLNVEGNPFEVVSASGELTDSLIFSTTGHWSEPAARRALAACVDPSAAAAASRAASGVEVAAHQVHLVSPNDALARRFDDIVTPRAAVDIASAAAFAGSTVRIGRAGASTSEAAIVDSIRASCEPAGISVVDAGANMTRQSLTGEGAAADVLLQPVDPATEYPGPTSRAQDLDALRREETRLWDILDTLPLASHPRNFAVDRRVGNVVEYSGSAGIGWNMDRWQAVSDNSGSTASEK